MDMKYALFTAAVAIIAFASPVVLLSAISHFLYGF